MKTLTMNTMIAVAALAVAAGSASAQTYKADIPMVASNARFRKESGHGLTMSAYDPNRTSRAARSVLAIASSFRRALLANRFRKSPVKTAVACRAGQSSSFLRQTST